MREDKIFGIVERAGAVANSSNGKKRGKQPSEQPWRF
jgi:hypothetical protein